MIDLKQLRDNPDIAKESQRIRGEDPALVDELLAADVARREAIAAADEARATQKSFSKDMGRQMKTADDALKQQLREEGKKLADTVKEKEAASKEAEARVHELQMRIGNLVQGAPAGGEDDFEVLEHIGEPPTFDFEPRDHLELGEMLGILDMERGAKVSGSRFYFLKGAGARLQLAMLNLAVQKATAAGYELMITPVIVNPETMSGTGFLGKHSDEIYYLQEDDQYLVGTSEVALAGFHSQEIIDLADGPLRYAGWSSCFRREAGSYGKDTRGILRVHQFDKVEMFTYCKPEDAQEEHQRLLNMEREMLAAIEVPYRIIDVAGGDLGSSAARKFDTEAWVPTQKTYRELTSTSNCTTFQARRLGIRYRDEDGKTQIAATLNGTLATTRWLVAILENHQQADGSVRVPAALQPYVGTDVLKPKA